MNLEGLCQLQLPQRWTDEPTPPRRERLWIKEGKKCHWCGHPTRLVAGDALDQATVDHVIPRYKGGTNDEENLVSACHACNARRNSEDMKGLPEGSLLGKFQKQVTKTLKQPKRVSLTGDEKRAILAKIAATPTHFEPIEVIRDQRDQALKAVIDLRQELEDSQEVVAYLEDQVKSMTVWQVIRRDLLEMLKEKDGV
jgi:5-methylcytosine-specific restriction endonuclease McrA